MSLSLDSNIRGNVRTNDIWKFPVLSFSGSQTRMSSNAVTLNISTQAKEPLALLTNSQVTLTGNLSAPLYEGDGTYVSNVIVPAPMVVSNIQFTDAQGTIVPENAALVNTVGYIALNGSGFGNPSAITISTTPAMSITSVSSTQIRAQIPALQTGLYPIFVESNGYRTSFLGYSVSPLPTWLTSSVLPSALKLDTYSQTLAATESTNSPITYSIASNSSLPPGMSLSSGGMLSGIVTTDPANTSQYTFNIVATDAELQTATRAFTVSVVGNPPPVWTTATTLTNVTKGIPFTQTLVATKSVGSVTYSLAQGSSLPAGASLSSAGVLSGAITDDTANATIYTFTINAVDNWNQSVPRTFTLDATPSPIPTTGLLGWYDGASWTGTQWTDKSGLGNHVTTKTGTISNVGTLNSLTYLSGGTGANMTFPSAILPATYTLFHVARYNGSTQARIFQATNLNWLSGFGGNGSKSGVAYHNGWLTQFTSSLHGSDWVISTDQNSLYRSQGVTRGTTGAGNPSYGILALNTGQNNEPSDWAVAEVIVYNRTLSASEYGAVEVYLRNRYNEPVIWVTNETLPNTTKNTSFSQTLVATNPYGVSYALAPGSSLPAGISLSSAGVLSGAITDDTANSTTYTFTINAADVWASQTVPRTFSLTSVSLLTSAVLTADIASLEGTTNNAIVTSWGSFTTGNGAKYVTTGTYNSGPELQFTRASSHYFDAGSKVLNTGTNGGFTAIAHVKFNATAGNGWERIFEIGTPGTTPSDNILFARNFTSTNLTVTQRNGTTIGPDVTATGAITNGTWMVVAVRYITISGTNYLQIWKNGTLLAQTAYGTTSIANKTYPATYIGRSLYTGDAYFDGSMRAVYVYDRALSDAGLTYMTNYIAYRSGAVTGAVLTADIASLGGTTNNAIVTSWGSFTSGNGAKYVTTGTYNAGPELQFTRASSHYFDAGSKVLNTGTNGGFTAIAHVKFNATAGNGWERIFEFGNTPASPSDNLLLQRKATTTTLTFTQYNGTPASGASLNVDALTTITNGTWMVVAVRYITISGTNYLQIWKDGTLLTQTAYGTTTIPNKTYTVSYLGRSMFSADAYFDGSMRAVYVYDRALSDDDLNYMMNYVKR